MIPLGSTIKNTFTHHHTRLNALPKNLRNISFNPKPNARIDRLPTVSRSLCQLEPWSPTGLRVPLGQICTLRADRRMFSSTVLCSRARYLRFAPDPKHPFDIRRWDLPTKIIAGLIVSGATYYIYHLERVPETGRLRFMDVSLKQEAALAESVRLELFEAYQSHLLPPNHPLTVIVSKIVAQLLESSDLGTVKPLHSSPSNPNEAIWQPGGDFDGDAVPGSGAREWTVMVVHDPKTVNAMAAFANVVFFTGIIPVCEDEAGVAAVLAHEIGHVVARHSSEKYAGTKVLYAIGLLLNVLGLDYDLARFITKFFMELPNSRKQEMEADEIGLRLMSKACYDPRAMPVFMDRLGKATGASRYDFLHTHPASHRRVQRLEELLPEAFSLQAANGACATLQEQYDAFGRAVRSW